MYPPSWMLPTSKRLDLNSFGAAFAEAWARLEYRLLKLECWQSYREFDFTNSQKAFQSGDIDSARALLTAEAARDRPLFDDIRRRSVDYTRIRVVQTPLTSYLEYEMLAYRIRAAMGENVEIVEVDHRFTLPNPDLFDFLLFDRHTALIHDYGGGPVGQQAGGWVSEDRQTIAWLERRALALTREATPIRKWDKIA